MVHGSVPLVGEVRRALQTPEGVRRLMKEGAVNGIINSMGVDSGNAYEVLNEFSGVLDRFGLSAPKEGRHSRIESSYLQIGRSRYLAFNREIYQNGEKQSVELIDFDKETYSRVEIGKDEKKVNCGGIMKACGEITRDLTRKEVNELFSLLCEGKCTAKTRRYAVKGGAVALYLQSTGQEPDRYIPFLTCSSGLYLPPLENELKNIAFGLHRADWEGLDSL